MRKIDLALLRTYIAVVETGSLSAAAKIVGRTVSAVFYQIQRLEASLDEKLLLREKRRVRPSRPGTMPVGAQISMMATRLVPRLRPVFPSLWANS